MNKLKQVINDALIDVLFWSAFWISNLAKGGKNESH